MICLYVAKKSAVTLYYYSVNLVIASIVLRDKNVVRMDLRWRLPGMRRWHGINVVRGKNQEGCAEGWTTAQPSQAFIFWISEGVSLLWRSQDTPCGAYPGCRRVRVRSPRT